MISSSTESFRVVLLGAVLLLGAGPSAALAKEYDIRHHNNKSYSSACDNSPTCINWGGAVYTNGDTKVICTKNKCTMYEDDAPA